MRHSVRRWLFSAGAVVAAGAAVCGQLGTANAAKVATVARQTTAAYVPPAQDFNFGAHGAAVRSVQRRLNQLHYYAGPNDGQYGQDLAEAVWAFKETQGLPMNASTNTLVTYKFRRALINPRAPKVLVPKGGANRIEVNQNDEVLVLYRAGKVSLVLHVSTGGGYSFCDPHGGGCGTAITPDGNYKAYGFNPGWLTVPLGTMFNPVWFTPGYAIHGDIPVPWYPASHGCVRIWMDAATWFHKDVTIGGRHATRVYIRGVAPYQPSIVG